MPAHNAPTVHFGILTILPEEFQAVLQRFPRRDIYRAKRAYNLSELRSNDGATYTVALLNVEEQGTGAAQGAARDLIDDLAPGWVLLVGIAGGRPDADFTLGDVILSTRIYDFTVNAKSSDHSTEYSMGGGGVLPEVNAELANLPAVEAQLGGWNTSDEIGLARPSIDLAHLVLKSDIEQWNSQIRHSLSHHFPSSVSRKPKYFSGPIGSSDSLIKDPAVLIPWLTTVRKLCAVEMEAAGVFRAMRRRDGEIPFLAIKGLSDIVGLARDDPWKFYACNVAASFAKHFIRAFPSALANPGIGTPPTPVRPGDPEKDLDVLQAKAARIERRVHRGKSGRKVSRADLDILMGAVKADASQSVLNLSGDLSWIRTELPTLKLIRAARPGLRMSVFFDPHRVSAVLLPLMNELRDLGFELRPYPIGFLTSLKCVLIDRDGPRPRAYVVSRAASKSAPVSGGKSQEFLWKQFGDGDVELDTLKALARALDITVPESTVVAIIGVNNVGKTQLASRLATRLRQECSVDLVHDIFREPERGITPHHNCLMLWKQRVHELQRKGTMVKILDRTVPPVPIIGETTSLWRLV